eukprot:gene3567-4011_t
MHAAHGPPKAACPQVGGRVPGHRTPPALGPPAPSGGVGPPPVRRFPTHYSQPGPYLGRAWGGCGLAAPEVVFDAGGSAQSASQTHVACRGHHPPAAAAVCPGAAGHTGHPPKPPSLRYNSASSIPPGLSWPPTLGSWFPWPPRLPLSISSCATQTDPGSSKPISGPHPFRLPPMLLAARCLLGKRTPLYEVHLALGGKMVDFAGWDLPVQYKGRGLNKEAVHCRTDAALFDVSHMGQVTFTGPRRHEFIE